MIKLVYDLYADATPYGYNLVRKTGKMKKIKHKDGTEEETEDIKTISYHGDLAAVINAALRTVQRDVLRATSEDINLWEAVATIQHIHEQFENVLEETVGKHEHI